LLNHEKLSGNFIFLSEHYGFGRIFHRFVVVHRQQFAWHNMTEQTFRREIDANGKKITRMPAGRRERQRPGLRRRVDDRDPPLQLALRPIVLVIAFAFGNDRRRTGRQGNSDHHVVQFQIFIF